MPPGYILDRFVSGPYEGIVLQSLVLIFGTLFSPHQVQKWQLKFELKKQPFVLPSIEIADRAFRHWMISNSSSHPTSMDLLEGLRGSLELEPRLSVTETTYPSLEAHTSKVQAAEAEIINPNDLQTAQTRFERSYSYPRSLLAPSLPTGETLLT